MRPVPPATFRPLKPTRRIHCAFRDCRRRVRWVRIFRATIAGERHAPGFEYSCGGHKAAERMYA